MKDLLLETLHELYLIVIKHLKYFRSFKINIHVILPVDRKERSVPLCHLQSR